jgi:hypothetical protein
MGLDKIVIYYKREGQEEFELAGRTKANEYRNKSREKVHLISVTTEEDFRSAFQKLQSTDTPISEGIIFTHGTDRSLEFKPVTKAEIPGANNGSMEIPELKSLAKLNFTNNATLDIRSCASAYHSEVYQDLRGTGRKLGRKEENLGNTVAGHISKSQDVTTIGAQGYGSFSTVKSERLTIDKLGVVGNKVYLNTFMNSEKNKNIPKEHLPTNNDYKERAIIPHAIYKNGELIKN